MNCCCHQLVTSSSLLFKMSTCLLREHIHYCCYQSSHPKSLLIHCSCQDVKGPFLLILRLQGSALSTCLLRLSQYVTSYCHNTLLPLTCQGCHTHQAVILLKLLTDCHHSQPLGQYSQYINSCLQNQHKQEAIFTL